MHQYKKKDPLYSLITQHLKERENFLPNKIKVQLKTKEKCH